MFSLKRQLAVAFALITIVSFSDSAQADGSAANKYKIPIHEEVLTFKADVSRTKIGLSQVTYTLVESKAMVFNARFIVLTGRDIDGDGKIDTWFFSNDVMHPITEIAENSDGWDVAKNLIASHPLLSSRNYKQFFVEAILTMAPVSGAQHQWFENSALSREIDLMSIELRIRYLHDQHLITPHSELVVTSLLSDAWADLAHRVVTAGAGGYAAAIVGDFALVSIWMWATKLVLTAVSATSALVGERLMQTAVGDFISETFERYSTAISSKASRMAAKVVRLAPVRLSYSVAQEAMARMTLPQIERLLFVRDTIARVMTPMIRAGASQWDYILLNLAVQTPIEIWGRRKELYDSKHPERLVVNILKDKDMMQNIGYMLLDTTLQTTVSTYFPKEQMGRRMIICGFISVVDSLTMSTVFKHETDPIRAGVDTAWEASIGNAQTQFDLRSFQILAEHFPNSQPRLLGYAVAATDQALGFLGYFYTTKWYEQGGGHDLLHHFFENPLQSLKLIPVKPLPGAAPRTAEVAPPPDLVVPPLNFYLLPISTP